MSFIYFVKSKIYPLFKPLVKGIFFIARYRFFPPPLYSDMSGYECLLNTIIKKKIYNLEGDVVEIGVFFGGGTYKLSRLLDKLKTDKKLYALDVFEPDFDHTSSTLGEVMSEVYTKRIPKGKNQYQIYAAITKKCKNIVTLVGDSKKTILPCEKIAFAYIDGNHSCDYVKNDFYLVWDKLVPNGVIAFDDYGSEFPGVTEMIHKLIGEHNSGILRIWTNYRSTIYLQKK